jgi:two-component system, cell cycle sensor histidine kinase and response regulator CckA
LDEHLGLVNADPGQIEQILMNLTVNARDAMPSGGTLTLETANTTLTESGALEAPDLEPGDYVVLAVSDTGTGMDQVTLSKLFEPFFTTKEKGKGTGLGLSSVYGIVRQHRGHVIVWSEPGRGAVFRVYLPRVYEQLEVSEDPTIRNTPAGGQETVLLVEDEEIVNRLVSEALEMYGYRVLSACEPAQALHLSGATDEPIDLLLTDVVLPGMDGARLYRHLAEQRPSLKVLYISGYTEDAIVHRGVLDPGVNFLHKPFTVDGLLEKVRVVLNRAVVEKE